MKGAIRPPSLNLSLEALTIPKREILNTRYLYFFPNLKIHTRYLSYIDANVVLIGKYLLTHNLLTAKKLSRLMGAKDLILAIVTPTGAPRA